MPHRAEVTGSLTAGHQLPTPGPGSDPSTTLPEGIDGVPIIVNGQIIGWNIGGEFFTQAEVDSLIATGNFPEDPATGGTAGRTISPSEVEANQAAAELARARAGAVETPEERAAALALRETPEERALNRQADIEAAALREEGANRRERLGTLTRLIEGFLGQQSQARDTLANLQPDPFRFAAVAGGVAPFGATPQQGFQQQLQQFAGAAVPQFDPSGSAASLDPIIAQLTGAQAPQQPQGFGAPGLAGGGTVPAPFETMSARLVGEKGPEVMVTSPQGVTILPLGKGAQEGGFFPFKPIKSDPFSMLASLTTSGIFPRGTIPRGNIQADQSIAGFSGGLGFPSNFFNNMGIRPQFFSKFGSPETFFRDPNTPGQFRLVTDTGEGSATGAIQPRSVVQVADTAQFGTLGGTAIGFNELRDQLAQVGGRPSRFTQFSAPLIEPTTGTLLPAPFTVAREMNQLRVTNPTAFNLLLNAYELAGQPASSVLSTIQAALPFGAERGAVGLR